VDAGSTNTSASHAKRAWSVTTRANPAWAPSGAYSPNESECSIDRSTTSRGTFCAQYVVRRKPQIASRSSRRGSVEIT
jgi:hypothetical protein